MSLVANLATAFTNTGTAIKAAKQRANHTGTQLAATISDFQTTVLASPIATTIANGLMSSTDKAKLDGLLSIFRTTANVSSTSVALTGVAGLVFTGVAGKSYSVSFTGTFQTVAPGTGARFGLTGTGDGIFAGSWRAGISATAVATELALPISSKASNIVTTGVSAINTPHHVHGEFIFHCTTPGTIQVTFGTEIAASSATLLNGASLVVLSV